MYLYFIYETTCLKTNKKYIGKHKTKNIDDGYLGSGVILQKAIQKYGAKNFQRNIICFCSSEEELNKREKELITEDVIKGIMYYNICNGGQGGKIKKINPMLGKSAKDIPGWSEKLSSNSAKRDRRIHIFEHENGEKFIGEVSQFYKEYDLCRAHTSRVVRGIKKSIKGWKYKGVR